MVPKTSRVNVSTSNSVGGRSTYLATTAGVASKPLTSSNGLRYFCEQPSERTPPQRVANKSLYSLRTGGYSIHECQEERAKNRCAAVVRTDLRRCSRSSAGSLDGMQTLRSLGVSFAGHDHNKKSMLHMQPFVVDGTLNQELALIDTRCNKNGINNPGKAFLAVIL
jgi:hypothetical protein